MRVDRSQSLLRQRRVLASLGACLLLVAAGVSVAASSGGGGAPKGASPVRVDNERSEQDLALVRLVSRATERLGIQTTSVERRPTTRTQSFGGFVMTAPGRVLQIVSPGDGTVLAAGGAGLPYPGTRVEKGEELLRLLVVSPAEAAQAREIVEVAAARLAVAEAALEEQGDAGLLEVERARSSLEAARHRQRLLTSGAGSGAERLAPLLVTSPFAGVVSSLAVSAGQSVSAGAALVELVQTDPVWVRTPLFSGDLSLLDPRADASVRRLGERDWRSGPRIAGPPTANASSSSVDLFFELPNPSGELRPGERVEVRLAFASQGPAIVLPHSAVVYDIHGASWVYEELESDVYVRRRLEIDFVRGDDVVARSGPADGARIVTEGAAELFGAEFGIGR